MVSWSILLYLLFSLAWVTAYFMFTRILTYRDSLRNKTNASVINEAVMQADPFADLMDQYRYETCGRYARYSRI